VARSAKLSRGTAHETTISGNIVRNSGQGGIGLFGGDGYSGYGSPRGSRNVTITGNLVENSAQWSSSSFRAGISVDSTAVAGSNIRVVSNIATDNQTTKTQQYGFEYAGPAPSGVWVDPSNQFAGNAVSALHGYAPVAVTGAKSGNAALASLLSTLAGFGLITDSTS